MRFQNTVNASDFVKTTEEVLAIGKPTDTNEIKALVKCMYTGELIAGIWFEIRETASVSAAVRVDKTFHSLAPAVEFYNSL